jgi:hypothetical protein
MYILLSGENEINLALYSDMKRVTFLIASYYTRTADENANFI